MSQPERLVPDAWNAQVPRSSRPSFNRSMFLFRAKSWNTMKRPYPNKELTVSGPSPIKQLMGAPVHAMSAFSIPFWALANNRTACSSAVIAKRSSLFHIVGLLYVSRNFECFSRRTRFLWCQASSAGLEVICRRGAVPRAVPGSLQCSAIEVSSPPKPSHKTSTRNCQRLLEPAHSK